jgi:hypothetical protein
MTCGKEATISFSGQLVSDVTACHDSNALSATGVMRENIVYCLQDNVLLFLDWLFNYFMTVSADHGGRSVYGMNCLRQLKCWGRGFEFHSRMDVCVCLLCVCVVLCVK